MTENSVRLDGQAKNESVVRAAWTKPAYRVVEAREAQADFNSNSDGSLNS
jgi:hypothetical protein